MCAVRVASLGKWEIERKLIGKLISKGVDTTGLKCMSENWK
jgi:hypothetical protein